MKCMIHLKMGYNHSKTNLPSVSSIPALLTNVRVLFLDVNGVLNCSESEKAIEYVLLQRVARIVETTQCKVIVSSSFRRSRPHLNYLWSRLESVGITRAKYQLPSYIHTPDYRILERTDEILSVILDLGADPRYHVTHWVAIDDKDLLSQGTDAHRMRIEGHAIQTKTAVGITEADVERALQCLGH